MGHLDQLALQSLASRPVWPPRPEILALQLTGQEKDEMRKAANRAGMPMSVFVRPLTMAAIRKGDTVVTTVKAA
jgi:hypothetical protein